MTMTITMTPPAPARPQAETGRQNDVTQFLGFLVHLFGIGVRSAAELIFFYRNLSIELSARAGSRASTSFFGKYPTTHCNISMLLSKFRNNNRRINDNTRKPRRSSWAVGVGRHRKSRVGIAPASNDEDEIKKQKQPTKPKKKKTATTNRRGKSSMTTGRVRRSETKNHPTNINVPLGVIAVDVVPPLMTQDELHRAKKKCHTTAHRLHKIKRRLLLDIAEEQSMTSEATSHATPSATAVVERSADDQPTTTTSNRRPRRGRRNRTASFMPQHQNSDSTMETFFGASSSSFGSSFDDTENAGASGD